MSKETGTYFLIVLLAASMIVLISCGGSKQLAGAKHDAEYADVYSEIMKNDSILFMRGYNQCDTAQVRSLLDASFEFYHDQAGLISSGPDFLNTLAALCNLDYHATRELDVKRNEIHLLKNSNTTYGVLQSGHHSFYAEKNGQSRHLTSTARFYHIWIKSDDQWKLRRVISFDHK